MSLDVFWSSPNDDFLETVLLHEGINRHPLTLMYTQNLSHCHCSRSEGGLEE